MSSTVPRMPCSGLKSATSFTSFAPKSTSIVVAPSRAMPVWLVTRPTRFPRSGTNPSARSTSSPVITGNEARGTTAPDAPKSRPLQTPARAAGGRPVTAAAATVATRARSGVTSPLPSGWTRFDRKTTNIPVDGSIQIDVPVKPVCPKEPIGSSSPRFDENAESMSHPRPRVFVSRSGEAALVIFSTASGDRIRAL